MTLELITQNLRLISSRPDQMGAVSLSDKSIITHYHTLQAKCGLKPQNKKMGYPTTVGYPVISFCRTENYLSRPAAGGLLGLD